MFFSRGENKYQDPYTFQDMYKEYIKDKKEGTPYYIPYSVFVDLCGNYYKELVQKVLDGDEVDLGFKMGKFSIIKKKVPIYAKKQSMNWVETNKIKKQVRILNEHSKGFTYRMFWNKRGSIVSNLFTYGFVFTRANKRNLAKIIKSGKTDYYEKD
jgi:hypothetical protein